MSSRHVKPPGVSANIFMNYRREDSAGHAGRLFDALSDHFAGQLFMDVDTLEPGTDFIDAIEQAVGSCDALIVVIGRQWLTIADKSGRRRLEDPADFVRVEIESALARKIRVIPVLVQDAPMPRADELPPSLARLARRHGIELSDDRWKYDVDRLAQTIRDLLADLTPGPSKGRSSAPGSSPASVARPVAPPPTRTRAWLVSLAALVLVASVVLVSLAWTRQEASGNGSGPQVQPPTDVVAVTVPAAGGGIASPAIGEPAVSPAGEASLAGDGVLPEATAPPEPPPAIETVPRVVETPALKDTYVEVPKPVTRVTPVQTPVQTPVPTAVPTPVPRPTPKPTESTVVFVDDDEASTHTTATDEEGTSDPVPSPPPATRPARTSILTPRNGEVVDSEVMVEGLVFGLGEQQIFLGIRQKNGAIYPRGELFPNADGQWSIKLRSSKEKTFEILVVTSTSEDATRVLRDQKSRDDGLAVLPEGASISSGVVTLQRPGKLIRVLRPLVPGSSG